MNNKQRWLLIEGLIVVALFAAAFTVRFYRLQEFPPGLYVDEAANGVDALDILDGRHALFFERNTGREPILIYLQAAAILLFGATPYALRVVPALIGALTVPAIYWMVREAFRTDVLPSRWLGLWTALFVAFSYWHISLSRLGFRAILLPLAAALAFAFFWRSWNRLVENLRLPWLDLILCGIFTGLCLYTYTASRLTPLWLALTFFVGGIQVIRSVGLSKLLVSFGVITSVALLVFIPLGSYFLLHPDQFYGRAADVSIFNPYFAGDLPGRALVASIVETARMFVDRADPNLRHNPAGRPVFNLLMTVWLLAGLVVAIVRIRILPYFFAISGFLLFAIPAVITAEGLPHSLRAIGMLPMAYLLAVIAMMAAGQWLAPRFKWAALWTPLPFLLISAILGTQSYFGAWQDLGQFRGPFLSDFLRIDMSTYGESDGVWVWPFSPNYHWSDNTFYPLEYLHQGEADYGFVTVDDETASDQLAELARGKRTAYLVRTQDMSDVFAASYVMGDPKHLIQFMLEKHARAGESVDAEGGIPFQLFELPADSDYSVYNQFDPFEISFANQVKLAGADMGRTTIDLDNADAGESAFRLPSGEKLWIVLNWAALAPINIDLKASIMLKDEAGNLAGQVDDLLVGDRYPVERIWEAGEATNSYHILPLWAGIPPGTYSLYVKIYEDETGRVYPVVDGDGVLLDREALLGEIEVEAAVRTHPVYPENRLEPAQQFESKLDLLGFDLPKLQVAPGDRLPLTLYWQAQDSIRADHLVNLSLVDSEKQKAAAMEAIIGGNDFPTRKWREGEIVRDWKSLAIPSETDEGVYELLLTVDETTPLSETVRLGEIEVRGRPRVFDRPSISDSMAARFGPVDLLGVDAPADLAARAGESMAFDLVWQVTDVPERSLVRFVHILGEDGIPIAQQDIVPCGGACPSHTWLAGEILVDPVSVQIPDALAPGEYRLVAGWYEAETFLRRPLLDATGADAENELITLPITVEIK